MEISNQIIFWDFDGTLGYRRGGMWGAAMIEALDEFYPNHTLEAPDFRPFLITGFPWHNHHVSHSHFSSSDDWWEPIIKKFIEGFKYHGYTERESVELAYLARKKFIQLDRWTLFEDTIDTLEIVQSKGWESAIISNHIPELDQIINYLGIDQYFKHIINSAKVGYEKPNPKIYEIAINKAGIRSNQNKWMIGDNIEADYFGAESIGIQAILVRSIDSKAKRNCKSLREVIRYLGAAQDGSNFS